MASQVSPGIVLKERDLSNAVIIGAQQITGAYASTFQKGPIGKITSIASQKEFVSIFGKPSESNAEDWFVASEFLNYGGRLSVVRVQSGVSNATDDGASIVVKNQDDWESGNGTSKHLVGRSAGSWANDLMVVFVDRGADQYVTFNAAPAGISVGTLVEFTSGATGYVYTYNSLTKTAAIVLDDPTDRITTSDTLDTPDIGSVTSGSLVSGGTTYRNGTNVVTTGGSGSGLTVNTTVSVGSAVSISAGPSGASYVTGNGIATTGGGGTGLTVNIVASGAISSIAIANPGSGYTVGATVTVVGGNNSATFTIASVSGAITAIAVNSTGSGYVAGDDITITGYGGNATFEVTAVTDTTISVSAVADWYSTTEIGSTGIKLTAIGSRPGTSSFAEEKGISYDELHMAIIDITGRYSGVANNVLERLTYLSKITDGRSTENAATYYKDVINLQSEYVFVGLSPVANVHPGSTGVGANLDQVSSSYPSGSKIALLGRVQTVLSGGNDDYAYSNAEFGEAMDLFLETEEVEVDFVLMGGSMATEVDTKAKANKVINISSSRKDCIAFVSPHKGNQVGANGTLNSSLQKENTINFFTGLTSTSFAIFDSGYKYFYDRFNDKYRYIPCNGDVAGLCVSTSASLDDWYSPAGVNRGSLRNAIKLAYNPSKSDRDELYQNRINPIVTFPGSGVTLFGDKTALASPSAFDRINVRRLFLNVEKRVGNLSKQVLFEQNDFITRSSFASAVTSYLSEIQARRGITDFLVVCDDTNNTPDVIDRNEFVAELFIKPTRSINYITVTFTATKSGVSFAEVIGR